MKQTFYIIPSPYDAQHHGVLGMKWGIRRYQNKDGSLTARGRRRLGIGNDKGVSGKKVEATNTNKNGVSARGNVFSDASNLREVNRILRDTDNCSLCTFAFDLRNRGIDVRAGGSNKINDGKTHSEIASWYRGGRQFSDNEGFYKFVDPRGHWSYPGDVKDLSSDFERNVISMGNGTSGHMTFQNVIDRDKAAEMGLSSRLAGGHDVFYKVEDGTIYIYDAQMGKKMTLEEYKDVQHKRGVPITMVPTGYLRTDDLEPIVDAMTTGSNGQLIGLKMKTGRVAEDNQTPTMNYSPPTSSTLRTKPIDYSPPYKSKNEFEMFKEDAIKKLDDISDSVRDMAFKTKKKLKDFGEVALEVADVLFWVMLK